MPIQLTTAQWLIVAGALAAAAFVAAAWVWAASPVDSAKTIERGRKQRAARSTRPHHRANPNAEHQGHTMPEAPQRSHRGSWTRGYTKQPVVANPEQPAPAASPEQEFRAAIESARKSYVYERPVHTTPLSEPMPLRRSFVDALQGNTITTGGVA